MNSQYLGQGLHIRARLHDYVVEQEREGGMELLYVFDTLDEAFAAKEEIALQILAFESSGAYQ